MKSIASISAKVSLFITVFVLSFVIASPVFAQTSPTPAPTENTAFILTSIDTIYNIYMGGLSQIPPNFTTTSRRPMFRGGATPNSSIKVAETNGTEICTAITGENGKWECQPAADFQKNGYSIEFWAKLSQDYVKKANLYLNIESKTPAKPTTVATTQPTTSATPSTTVVMTETPSPIMTDTPTVEEKIVTVYPPNNAILASGVLGFLSGTAVTFFALQFLNKKSNPKQ